MELDSEDSGNRMSSPYPGGPTQEDGARRVSGVRSPMLPLSLTPVDRELLRSRLVSTGPGVLRHDPDALVFTPHTFTQQRQRNAPKPMRYELLVRYKKRIWLIFTRSFICALIHSFIHSCVHSGHSLLLWKPYACCALFQPALKQNQKQPEYIDRKNRERLISAGQKPPTGRTDPSSSSLHLPQIPDHLKERQVSLFC